MHPRQLVRNAAELVLAGSGLPWLARRRRTGTLVLAYHNVVPAGTPAFGDRSLHRDVRVLRAELEALARTHDVVELAQATQPPTRSRPRIAITFDDAYAGALELGLELVGRLGLPATVFVAPALLGRPAMWWDRLADPLTGLAADLRNHALGPLRGEHDRIMAWSEAQRLPQRDPGPLARIATERELASAAARPGISLGLHTWSHPNLAALTGDETRVELARTLEWLRSHPGSVEPRLAYPYGRWSPAAMDAARDVGLAAAFRVEGGWIDGTPPEPLALPRLNVPAGMSVQGLLLRAAGVLAA